MQGYISYPVYRITSLYYSHDPFQTIAPFCKSLNLVSNAFNRFSKSKSLVTNSKSHSQIQKSLSRIQKSYSQSQKSYSQIHRFRHQFRSWKSKKPKSDASKNRINYLTGLSFNNHWISINSKCEYKNPPYQIDLFRRNKGVLAYPEGGPAWA